MRLISLLSAALLALAGPAGLAAEPTPVRASLVKDLSLQPGTQGSSPRVFTTLAGRVYFAATAPRTGEELYSTDAQGDLRLLADITPGFLGSAPEAAAVLGDKVIVSADDGVSGRQIWSVPVAGGKPVRLTSPSGRGESSGTMRVMATFGDRTLLRLSSLGPGMLSTDGTPAGTYVRSIFETGFPLVYVEAACVLGDAAILGGSGFSGPRLLRSNGLPGGDSEIATLPTGAGPRAAVAAGGHCYFLLGDSTSALGWRLWRTDGTPEGSLELASASGVVANSLVAVGNDVYLLDTTPVVNATQDVRARLWRLAAGTDEPQLIADVTGPSGQYGPLWTHEGLVLFNGFVHGGSNRVAVLYGSDGTSTGTRLLYPQSGTSPFHPGWAPVSGAIVAYGSHNPGLRIELPSGTTSRLGSIAFDYASSALLDGIRIGAGGGTINLGEEVWITQGTDDSTRLLHDIWNETADGIGYEGSSTAAGDTLFFTHGFFWWPEGGWSRVVGRTDGSEAGTTLLPAVLHRYDGAQQVQQYGDDGVLFTAGYNRWDLYRADAALTSATLVASDVYSDFLQSINDGALALHACSGMAKLCSIRPGGTSTELVGFQFVRGTVIGEISQVAIFANAFPGQIWRSDGTAPGTYMLSAGREVQVYSELSQNLMLDGKVYFISCPSSGSCDLTVTDGTAQGTHFLLPVPTRGIRWSARAGNRLVMELASFQSEQVWSTDGTVAGTRLLHTGSVSQMVSTGDWVHMKPSCPGCEYKRLVTDGTPEGTRMVDLPFGIRDSDDFAAALGDNAVVFTCVNEARGTELCLSDASGETIRPMPEIFPGKFSSSPELIGRTASAVYFSARDGLHGRELWQLRELPDVVFADGLELP